MVRRSRDREIAPTEERSAVSGWRSVVRSQIGTWDESHYYEREGESHNEPNISSRQHSLLREIGNLCCIFVQFGL